MTKRLVIVGAGGFGRGVCSWVRQSPNHLSQHAIGEVVFIDDSVDSAQAPAPVISTLSSFSPESDDLLLCAVGIPAIRRRIVTSLAARGAVFHTFVDDRAVIGERVSISRGAIICPGVTISADAAIGEQVHINFNCSIGHDTQLGAFTTLSPAVNIMGEVIVGEGVFFGGNAAVLPRLEVADQVTVGAGAVCARSIQTSQTVVGVPASPLPFREKNHE